VVDDCGIMHSMASKSEAVLREGEDKPLQLKCVLGPLPGFLMGWIDWLSLPATIALKAVVLAALAVLSGPSWASGGLVLSGGTCTMHIDFYSARFTAYQPDTRGSEEFCETLPDTGLTIIVLDYLHPSLKEVPVDFRIIRDVTGQGRFAKLEDVQALGDIEPLTVFYQPPMVRPDGSFKIEYDFKDAGKYIGVVTAGHPTNDNIYAAVFPFTVGEKPYNYWLALGVLLAGFAGYFWRRRRAPDRPD